MRHTEIATEEETPLYGYLTTRATQSKLDAFWELIENHYEEEWRVEFSGTVSLAVDDKMLERVLSDNVAVAWFKFGSNKGGETEDGVKYFTSRPEYLKGLWSIQGIYNSRQAYVGGTRTYFFEPEG